MPENNPPGTIREEYYAIRTETVSELRKVVESLKTAPENGKNSELLAEIRKLETELKRLKKTKRYGLVWEEKPETFEAEAKNSLPVLEEVSEFAFADGSDRPQNLIIEGDNFHSLAALSYTHKGSVDVIYIDPPYNTGNKDFVYNDHYVDKEDDFRHSKWLSFMEKRLRLARDLLKETGVIFISIDDNEQAQLKMLCDEVFGEGNFAGTAVWYKKRKWSFLTDKMISLTEYIHVYGKECSSLKLLWELSDNSESQPLVKRTNGIKELLFPKSTVLTKLANGIYRAGNYWTWTSWVELLHDVKIENGVILDPVLLRGPFTWSQVFLDTEIENWTDILINTWNFQPRVIRHNSKSRKGMPSFIDWRLSSATNEDAYADLGELLWEGAFQYSKPRNLIKFLLQHASSSALVLDFFAGSGTTGHAVLQLNKEDGGNRKFILCSNRENSTENPDKNLCREVCYERVKRVSQGYSNAKGEAVEGLGGNVRYFKTAFVPHSKSTDDLRHAFIGRSSDLLRIREDCFDTVGDFEQDDAIRAFSGTDKMLAVLYDPYRIGDFKAFLRTVAGPVSAYVFTAAAESYAEEFAEFSGRVALESVPDAILSSYRTIYGL